jgi:hypothetical protein
MALWLAWGALCLFGRSTAGERALSFLNNPLGLFVWGGLAVFSAVQSVRCAFWGRTTLARAIACVGFLAALLLQVTLYYWPAARN